MKIKEKVLFPILDKLKKDELKEYLRTSFYEMSEAQRRDVFGEIYKEKLSKGRKPLGLYSEIERFYKKSVRGDYYAPFMINSKNYQDVPEETDGWFSELSYYLDESSRLVEEGEYDLASKSFTLLFELIDRMEEGEDIVFADEYGTWMITSDSDYNVSYIRLLSELENEEVFAEKVVPLLERDSSESLSGKVYEKVKKYSSPLQWRRIEEEIKLRKIRVK